MPKFKVQGQHHLTGKTQTLIYEAEDAAQAQKRGWDDGIIVETVAPVDEATSMADAMKKCPFCAEAIQPQAIKCKHCGEWLDGSGASRSARSPAEKPPWYFRTSVIIAAFCCVGPLALPMIWWHPKLSVAWKIGLTVVTLGISWLLFQSVTNAIHSLKEYYKLLDSVAH